MLAVADEAVVGGAGVAPGDAKLLTMSTLTEDGVMAVKQMACDRLLASRVEAKLQVSLRYFHALAACQCLLLSTSCT